MEVRAIVAGSRHAGSCHCTHESVLSKNFLIQRGTKCLPGQMRRAWTKRHKQGSANVHLTKRVGCQSHLWVVSTINTVGVGAVFANSLGQTVGWRFGEPRGRRSARRSRARGGAESANHHPHLGSRMTPPGSFGLSLCDFRPSQYQNLYSRDYSVLGFALGTMPEESASTRNQMASNAIMHDSIAQHRRNADKPSTGKCTAHAGL